MIQYHPNNPLRTVDWRWERARIIRESQLKVNKRLDDQWILSALKFQKDLNNCQTDFEKYDLVDKWTDIYFAYLLKGNDPSKQPIKAEIEARLLANQPFEEIAKKCGCSIKTIEAYEKLFFNVLEKLVNPAYIVHQVMGPAIHRGLYQREFDLLWKLYGYFCGPIVIDALTTTFTKIVKPENLEQVDSLFVDDTKATMRRKAAIAARSVAVTDMTQLSILEMYTRFLEIEKNNPSSSSKDLIEENINAMITSLGSIGWITGNKVPEKNSNRITEHYDKLAAEPRADEILAISLGHETKEHKELENIKIPEASTNEQTNK